MPSENTIFHLQLLRGTTRSNNEYTGLEGELTIDTEDNSLIIHDGNTKGGFRLLNKDTIETYINNGSFKGGKGDPGKTGDPGPRGATGYYYIPNVDSNGNLTWQINDSTVTGAIIPSPVNIKGDRGSPGVKGDPGLPGAKGDPGRQCQCQCQCKCQCQCPQCNCDCDCNCGDSDSDA